MKNGHHFLPALILSGCVSFSFSQSDWVVRSPLPSVNPLDSVFWYQDGLVAVFGGTYFSSPDGDAWTRLGKNPDSGSSSDTGSKLSNVIHMDSQYVALDNKGNVLGSTDSLHWTTLRSGSTNLLRSMAWTGTQLIAVGKNGTVITSPQGKYWTVRDPGTNANLVFVHWTGTAIAVVDEHATVLTSPDGIAWGSMASDSACTLSFSGQNEIVDYFIWTGSRIVGFCNEGRIQTTSDFNTWTSTRLVAHATYPNYLWTGSRFMICYPDSLFTSIDGETWSQIDPGIPVPFKSMTWQNGHLVLLNEKEDFSYSEDGLKWIGKHRMGVTQPLRSVVWTGTLLVAVGDSGNIVTSTDGAVWDRMNSGTTAGLKSIAWSGDRLVAVGNDTHSGATVALASADGISWRQSDSITSAILNGVTWDGKEFVVVGRGSEGGIVLRSEDGLKWISWTPPEMSQKVFKCVTWTGSQFLAIGENTRLYANPTIYTSSDGVLWKGQTRSGESWSLTSVKSIGSQSVAMVSDSTILTSSDGISWTSHSFSPSAYLYDVASFGNQIIAVGSTWATIQQGVLMVAGATILTSADGVSWINHPMEGILGEPTRLSNENTLDGNALLSVTSTGTTLVAVGNHGIILTSQIEPIPVKFRGAPVNPDISLRLVGAHLEVILPNSGTKDAKVEIYDLGGHKKVFAKESISDNRISLSLRGFERGVYVFKTEFTGKHFVREFSLVR
ncbi:MAG: hypothetical protein ABI036_16900 [Fibrobacteria bacterium]